MRNLLIVLTLVATSVSAQTKRAATFDDVLNIKGIQGATVSPDGRQVIYGVREWVAEPDKMESRSHLWKVPSDGSNAARQITFGEKGESQGQFSPDGKFISFVAARGAADAKSQIYLMSIDGGEAWKLTDAKENVQSYSWAPDSKSIAFVATDPRTAQEEADTKKRDDERVFEGDFRFAHVWVVDVDSKQATRVTEGTSYTVQGAPSWAPDSKRFTFGAAATPMLRDNRRDVYVATLVQANGPTGQRANRPTGQRANRPTRLKRSVQIGAATDRRAGRRTARRSPGSASRIPPRQCRMALQQAS